MHLQVKLVLTLVLLVAANAIVTELINLVRLVTGGVKTKIISFFKQISQDQARS